MADSSTLRAGLGAYLLLSALPLALRLLHVRPATWVLALAGLWAPLLFSLLFWLLLRLPRRGRRPRAAS